MIYTFFINHLVISKIKIYCKGNKLHCCDTECFTCAIKMPTTTPSWCRVPKAPRRGVGDTSPTYIGVRLVKRPQNSPITSRPAMIISKEEQRVHSPMRPPPIRAKIFTRIIDLRLWKEKQTGREGVQLN